MTHENSEIPAFVEGQILALLEQLGDHVGSALRVPPFGAEVAATVAPNVRDMVAAWLNAAAVTAEKLRLAEHASHVHWAIDRPLPPVQEPIVYATPQMAALAEWIGQQQARSTVEEIR
ncbi:hypothetical protein [Nocardia aurea]|uniref:hypothetical protein n=1 Tax=Nocardia aurea TaxID=2144174 RepID=UPI0033A429D7